MFFWVLSRNDIEDANPALADHVIISINGPDDDAPAAVKRNSYTKGVLVLHFDDLDEEVGPSFRRVYGRDVVLFNEEHAAHIHRFVKDADVDNIIVHCHMGVSRSAAVGAALSVWLNGHDKGFHGYRRGLHPRDLAVFSQRCLTPNAYVRRVLLNYLIRQETP
jgi:predicted protein tyrosine phosphatase